METMTSVTETIPTAAEASQSVEANNRRRYLLKLEANKRLASLALATRLDSKATSDARALAAGDREGAERKAAVRAWNAAEREARFAALDGKAYTVTLQHDNRKRWLATAVVVVDLPAGVDANGKPVTMEDTMRLSGLVTVVDSLSPVAEGTTVTVHLTRHDSRPDRKGKVHTTFAVESVGVSSSGERVALRGRLTASRFARIVASAL